MLANQHSITLHKATSDDASAIAALTDAAYQKYIPLIGRKPLPMTADYAKMAFENEIWLLHVEQQLAGVLVLEHEPDTLLIYSVAIQPEFQKQGLGRHLLAFAEEQAIQAGYRSIRLYTNEKFTYNINLYKSLGYLETSREPFRDSTLVHMAKTIAG
jgi:ribosomal protein S18 acetylase RimI-like enzyme